MELHGKTVLISSSAQNGYYEQIILKTQWGEKEFVREEGGIRYYKCRTQRKEDIEGYLYCTCGYEGVSALQREETFTDNKEKRVMVDESVPLKKRYSWVDENGQTEYVPFHRRIFVLPVFGCPVCKKEPDVILNGSFYEKVRVLHSYHTNIQSHPSIAIFAWENVVYGTEGIDKEGKKIGKKLTVKKQKYQLEVDLKTGETGLKYEGELIDEECITFTTSVHFELMEPFRELKQSLSASYALKGFFETCLKRRGIRYKTIEGIVNGVHKKREWRESLEDKTFIRIFPFLRYPQLETMSGSMWREMTPFFQERLDSATYSQVSVFEALTGHRSKMIRLLAEERENLETCLLFGHVIKDPNNLKKLLKPIGKCNNQIEGDVFFHFRSFPSETMMYFRNLYPEEKQFVKGLLKLHRVVCKTENCLEFTFQEISEYLIDTFWTIRSIKEILPSYQLPFQNDLLKLHDQVAKDYRKMKHVNKAIPYSEEERYLYHRTVGNYQFVLAKDTHELLEAGEEMDHCVGSYREQVLSGESIIVFVFNDQGERRLCLEVKGKERKQLMQAKRHGNQLPDAEEVKIVKKWAVLCQVNTDFTHDLRACNHTHTEV